MRALLRLFALVILAALAAGVLLTRPVSVSDDDLAGLVGDPQAGEAVFWAAGCASCHEADEAEGEARLILSGGQAFPSDFGTFRAPNISSDPTHGIGDWTLAEFITAVQNGVSPEGHHYYPAFPYTAYRLADRQDIVDLYAFMQTLPASDQPSEPHDVGFPFSIRRAVGAWILLFGQGDFTVSGDLSAEASRGRYLAEALAHCGECHTPRGALGGLDRARWFAGAPDPSGRGTVPNITPGTLGWTAGDIAAYLNDGFTPDFDVAGGHMRSVVLNMAELSDADRAAIAAYLLAVPDAP